MLISEYMDNKAIGNFNSGYHNSNFKNNRLSGCDAVYGKCVTTLQRNLLPLSFKVETDQEMGQPGGCPERQSKRDSQMPLK